MDQVQDSHLDWDPLKFYPDQIVRKCEYLKIVRNCENLKIVRKCEYLKIVHKCEYLTKDLLLWASHTDKQGVEAAAHMEIIGFVLEVGSLMIDLKTYKRWRPSWSSPYVDKRLQPLKITNCSLFCSHPSLKRIIGVVFKFQTRISLNTALVEKERKETRFHLHLACCLSRRDLE